MEKLILIPIGEKRESQIIPNNLQIPREGLGLCKMADFVILIYLTPASPGTAHSNLCENDSSVIFLSTMAYTTGLKKTQTRPLKIRRKQL